LSFLRLLTLKTFKICNPEYKITLIRPYKICTQEEWLSGEQGGYYTGPDYLEEALTLADDVIIFDMRDIGFCNHSLSEVHKSDILRNYFLFTFGGIWSDFDIVFFKPLPKELENVDFVCRTAKGLFSIGFIGGKEGSQFFRDYFELQKGVPKFDTSYQKYGTYLLNGKPLPKDVIRISMDLVYCINSTYVYRIFDGTDEPLTNITIGLHWYGGNPYTRNWENEITSYTFKSYDNVISKKLKELM